MPTKVCSNCGEEKEIVNFYYRKDNQEYRAECKQCVLKKSVKYRLGHKKEIRKYYILNKDKILKHRQDTRLNTRNNDLKREYGITLDDYNKMLQEQNGLCAICGERETIKNKNGTLSELCVDHDHITGKIRGLLCRECNGALGKFNDNIEILKSAIKYLKIKG